jgi:hypothetical protein
MYEYDVYADARRSMPRLREPLQTIDGEYYLVKTDVLAHQMTFSTSKESWSNLVTIPVSRVREIMAINRNGERVESLLGSDYEPQVEEPTYRTEEDSITRFDRAKKRKKHKKNNEDKPKSEVTQQPHSDRAHSDKSQGDKQHSNSGHNNSNRHHGKRHHHHNNNKTQE